MQYGIDSACKTGLVSLYCGDTESTFHSRREGWLERQQRTRRFWYLIRCYGRLEVIQTIKHKTQETHICAIKNTYVGNRRGAVTRSRPSCRYTPCDQKLGEKKRLSDNSYARVIRRLCISTGVSHTIEDYLRYSRNLNHTGGLADRELQHRVHQMWWLTVRVLSRARGTVERQHMISTPMHERDARRHLPARRDADARRWRFDEMQRDRSGMPRLRSHVYN